MQLVPLLKETKILQQMVDTFHFQHIYRERNPLVDALAKAGMLLEKGQWHIEEIQNDISNSYMHAPFCEII